MVKISSFKFRAQHVRGTQNVVADALSRMYHLHSEEPIGEPCALLKQFPRAFIDVIPHQLDDETLGPIIENINQTRVMLFSFCPSASSVARNVDDGFLR